MLESNDVCSKLCIHKYLLSTFKYRNSNETLVDIVVYSELKKNRISGEDNKMAKCLA
jgi:hypothetical protein